MCFSIQDRMELKRRLHCKPFSWYLKNVYPELVIPTSEGGPGGSLKQGTACLDSMGHLLDGNVGLYPCHDTGGNQVSIFVAEKMRNCIIVTEFYKMRFAGVGPHEGRPDQASRSLSDPTGVRQGHDAADADLRRQ